MPDTNAATWGIAALATLGVIARPWNLPEFIWAVAGAALLVLLNLLPWPDALAAAAKGTDVYFFLIGMMLLAEVARKEGLFDWLAAQAVWHSRGSAKRLFLIVYVVGTIVTVLLSNDATAVVLTPAVLAALPNREAHLAAATPLPLMMQAVGDASVELVVELFKRVPTLKAVKERGTLNCGVSQGLMGFSSMDDKGTWTGFDVDFCRAVAAAIFDDPAKVTFVPLDAASRFTALQSNGIDLLSRNSTWTMSREGSLGLMFAGVAYYDGQGFLLRRDAGIDTALQLGGKKARSMPNYVLVVMPRTK